MTFQMNQQKYLVVSPPGTAEASVVVGENSGDKSRLTVIDGELAANDMVLGLRSSSSGDISLRELSTKVTANDLTIGAEGTGHFTVEKGALDARDVMLGGGLSGVGTLVSTEFEGPNYKIHTRELVVGGAGEGELEISGGSRASSEFAALGRAGSARGHVRVSGNDGHDFSPDGNLLILFESRWFIDGGLTVGEAGEGTLEIDDLATVASGSGVVGAATGSVGIVAIDGSRFFPSPGGGGWGLRPLGPLIRSQSAAPATGRSAFARAVNYLPKTALGAETTGVGELELTTGVSAALRTAANLGSTTIGIAGTGTLSVSDATAVSGDAILGAETTGVGSAVIRGSAAEWHVDHLVVGQSGVGILDVRESAKVVSSSIEVGPWGVVRVSDAEVFSAGPIRLAEGSRLEGNGSITGAVQNDGTVGPGESPGELRVDGTYGQGEHGILEMEIAGTALDSYDHLVVSGQASFGGTLRLVFADTYVPRQGDEFNGLIVFGSRNGDFDDVQVFGILPDWQYEPILGINGFGIRSLSDAQPIPTPSTFVMFATALFAVLAIHLMRNLGR